MRRNYFQTTLANNFAGCLLVVGILGAPLVTHAADENRPSSPAVTYAYVGSTVEIRGGVSYGYLTGFAVAADGSAQALPGFPLIGASALLTSASNHVFAAGTNTRNGSDLVTYTPGTDGSLTQTSVVNVASYVPGGSYMVIYALNPDRTGQAFNVVMSCGSCNSEIVPFAVGGNGQLSFVGGMIYPGGAKWGGQFSFSPDNHYAYSVFYGGAVGEYQRQSDGTISYLTSISPTPPSNPGIQDSVCLPGDMAASSAGYMAMTWWGSQYWCEETSNGFLVGSYAVNGQGVLQLVPGSGIAPQVSEYSMAFDPTGTYLAIAGNDGRAHQGAIEVYKLQQNGTLAPTGPVQYAPAITNLTSVAWDNSNHVYAVGSEDYSSCSGTCGLYIFNSNDGVLTPAPGSPYAVQNVLDLAVLPVN